MLDDLSIPGTMRVPIFPGNGAIEFAERAVPEPGEGELLVRVRANALCGSDRHQFIDGSTVTPGHEASGIVVAAGSGTETAVGARGVIYLMRFCGDCRSCRLGLTNQCLRKSADMGFTQDGGYGAYEVIDERMFVPVEDDIGMSEATLLLETMGVGRHALDRAQAARPDVESVLVTGAGPMGLGTVAMARLLLGPDVPVWVTDVSPFRLRLAERLGATAVNLKAQPLAEAVADAGREPFDVAIDTTGRGGARQSAMKNLGQRGALVCVGHGEWLVLNVSEHVIAPERAVMGSEYFPLATLGENLALYREHREYLAQILTHRFHVEDIQSAFGVYFRGETGKVVVEQ